MYSLRLYILTFIYCFSKWLFVNGACTWPTEFNSNQWHDSSRGILTFGTDSMQGYTLKPTPGTTVDSWDCVSVSTYSTDGRIILITSQPFTLFSTNYYAYLCITVTKVTDSSYSYYINHEEQVSVNFERVFIYPDSTLTDHGTICSGSGASGGEYQMLIKEGSESSAKVPCPSSFLGQYGYTHITSGGATTCDKATSKIDMCTDTQQMKFDYSACATKVAYSMSDTVWCVNNVVKGDINYVMVFNDNDASSLIDDQTIYRFTCMAVSSDVTYASVSPRYCQKDQTPTQFPRTASGQPTGALLSFAPASVICHCNQPSSPSNGAVVANGVTATYSCYVGFTLNGDVERTCQNDGSGWNGTDPVCSQCASLSSVTGGTFTVTTNGTETSAKYTCQVGYSLDGVPTISCHSDGLWSSSPPTCILCEALTKPSSGTVTLSSSGGTSTATYTCASGYTLQGDTTRTCQFNGTWDKSQPSCNCNQPSSPSNGTVVANGVTAIYTCNVGFTLNGDVERTCQNDGSGWSGTVPVCLPCETLTNPSSGSVTLSSARGTSTATYTCASGYTLQGDTTRTCQLDGTWGNSQPTCNCNQPSRPSNGAVVANGFTATYTCNVHFTLNGDFERTCQTDGSGWKGTDPVCSQCATLSSVTGGTFTTTTTGTITLAKYTCEVGYSLNGSNTIICQSDGSWSSSPPTCKNVEKTKDQSEKQGNVQQSENNLVIWLLCSCLLVFGIIIAILAIFLFMTIRNKRQQSKESPANVPVENNLNVDFNAKDDAISYQEGDNYGHRSATKMSLDAPDSALTAMSAILIFVGWVKSESSPFFNKDMAQSGKSCTIS